MDAPPPTPPAAARTPRRGDSYVQSFARGLSVIRSFGADAPRQTLTEVAQRAGLTRAGARRILLTLAQLGYVRSHGRQFSLTPKILELGFAYLSSLPLWNLAQPVLQDLAAQTGLASEAAVLDGDDAVCVLPAPAPGAMGAAAGTGARQAAADSAPGRVLLAGLPPEEWRQRLVALAQRADVARAVDAARAQGWCLVEQPRDDGTVALAVPVVDRAGRTVAALDVSGPAPQAPLVERCLPLLRDAAQQIALLLRV